MQYETMLSTGLGILFGGLITWRAAHVYYKKAGDDLLAESKKLKAASDLILYKLQHPDVPTELLYDDNGEVSGMGVSMSAKL